MKDNVSVIEYKGIKYKLYFNLNVMQVIQEEYGTFEKWGDLTDGIENDGEPNLKAVIFGITAMINEGIDIENEAHGADDKARMQPMTVKQVGRIATEIGLNEAIRKLNGTVIESTASAEKNA